MRRFLIFIIPLLYYSCDEIVSDIDALTTQNAEQDAQIDSLMTALNDQQAYIDSLNNSHIIADSLLQLYADSLHNAQQTTLTELANSALNAGFVETQVFSGTMTTSWTDLDLSNAIGQKESLVLIRANFISGVCVLVFRPNGSTFEYTSTVNGMSSDIGVTLIHLSILGLTGYALITTDTDGIIEQRIGDTGGSCDATISVVFYLNQ